MRSAPRLGAGRGAVLRSGQADPGTRDPAGPGRQRPGHGTDHNLLAVPGLADIEVVAESACRPDQSGRLAVALLRGRQSFPVPQCQPLERAAPLQLFAAGNAGPAARRRRCVPPPGVPPAVPPVVRRPGCPRRGYRRSGAESWRGVAAWCCERRCRGSRVVVGVLAAGGRGRTPPARRSSGATRVEVSCGRLPVLGAGALLGQDLERLDHEGVPDDRRERSTLDRPAVVERVHRDELVRETDPHGDGQLRRPANEPGVGVVGSRAGLAGDTVTPEIAAAVAVPDCTGP